MKGMSTNCALLEKILVISMLVALAAIRSASAFKPNEDGHLGITSQALSAIQRMIDSETLKFSDRAIQQIRAANKATDCIPCQEDASLHFDDEAFAAGTIRLLNLKEGIISKITASSPDGESARRDLGGALHTLQDFYAHSNWVELGNIIDIDDRLGRSAFAGLPITTETCPSEPDILGGDGLKSETSGWFKIPLCDPPSRKCRHGVDFVCPSGLNKDSPSRPGYTIARFLAIKASEDFINQILDYDGSRLLPSNKSYPSVAGNAKAIKALMDIRGTLGVVIDNTGSMFDDIDGVKAAVGAIVAAVKGTPNEPDQYLLETFNDPTVGTPLVTRDADVFLAAVNALFASGGGDCPELAWTGLQRAVDASASDSTLFLFTDASAKDAFLASNVIAAAQKKQITITPLLTGTCSPVDPTFIRAAQETGGQLFLLAKSQVAQAFVLVKPQLSGDFVTILLVNGTLPGGPQEFEVPIDSSITNVVFSVSVDTLTSVSVLRPSGAAVVPGEPGVTITNLSAGRIITVNAPETGKWHIQIAGTGAFSASAKANSSIQFASFQFVELTGRPAHEGFFPIAGQPVVGSDQTGLASLFGPFATANFQLVSQSGATIQPVNLAQGNPDAAADEFVGVFGLPSQPFRVAVTGFDTSGLLYERLFPTLFRAQTVEVTVDTAILSLPAGATTPVNFIVRNLGNPASFNIVVTDNRGFITRVQPKLLTLDTNASGAVTVDVTVPTATPDGTNVSITTTATSTTDPSVTNSAALNLTTVSNRPPVCTAAQASPNTLWPPNHKLVQIGIVGVTDPDGDQVTLTVTGVTQDEPVSGLGDGDTSPDAVIQRDKVLLRAERDGAGNGRFYQITFTAEDSFGASCTGAVTVCVPHDQGKASCINDGQRYDSTTP